MKNHITSYSFLAILFSFLATTNVLAQDLGQGYSCSESTILRKGKVVVFSKVNKSLKKKIKALGSSKKDKAKKSKLKQLKSGLSACSKGQSPKPPSGDSGVNKGEKRVEIGTGSPKIVIRYLTYTSVEGKGGKKDLLSCLFVGFVEFDDIPGDSPTYLYFTENPSSTFPRTVKSSDSAPDYSDNYTIRPITDPQIKPFSFPPPAGKRQAVVDSIVSTSSPGDSDCEREVQRLIPLYANPRFTVD